MPTKVIMPQLGESVDEGTITKWLKTTGERIEEYEPLVEVNTDKVDTEVPSPASGTLLEIVVPEGTTIHAGTLLAWIGDEETPGNGDQAMAAVSEKAGAASSLGVQGQMPAAQTVDTATAHPSAPVHEAESAPSVGHNRDLGFISPVVARIASEEGIDLFQVTGTGQGGRITKRDVLAYLENRKKTPSAPVKEAAPTGVPMPASKATTPNIAPAQTPSPAPQPAVMQASSLPQDELVPLNAVRRAIAEHMVFSKHTSPHVTTVMEADLSRIVAHRQSHKEAFARDGVNLTYTPYFVAATVAALTAYPVVNSSWSDEGVLIHHQINVGMATSLGEGGLIVPVIKGADALSLLGLARTVNDLANRARARQLKPDEVKGGTFTITNHGTSGSLFATPIINQPQCGILGVGAIQKRVIVIDGGASGGNGTGDSIAIRPMAYLSLTFDHRILDGAIADYFLGKVVEYLEHWNG